MAFLSEAARMPHGAPIRPWAQDPGAGPALGSWPPAQGPPGALMAAAHSSHTGGDAAPFSTAAHGAAGGAQQWPADAVLHHQPPEEVEAAEAERGTDNRERQARLKYHMLLVHRILDPTNEDGALRAHQVMLGLRFPDRSREELGVAPRAWEAFVKHYNTITAILVVRLIARERP